MFFDFIRNIDKNTYVCEKTIGNWKLTFNKFDLFSEDSTIEFLIKFKEIVSCNGEFETGVEFNKLDSPSRKIKSINLIINENQSILYVKNSIGIHNSSVFIFFTIEDYYNFDYKKLSPNQINCIICPHIDASYKNKSIVINNNENIQIKDTEFVNERVGIIKEAATVLIDNFYIPETFYIPDTIELPLSFSEGLAHSLLCSLAANTKENDTSYIFGFKGYKTISLNLEKGHVQKNFSNDEIKNLYILYEWIYEKKKIIDIRLKIFNYLITLDTQNHNQDIINRLTKSNELFESAKHQFELVLEGNIKEHFENLNKANSKVSEIVNNMEAKIGTLTNSINAIVLGLLGFFISISSKLIDLNNLTMFIFITLLFFYLLFLKYIVFSGINSSKRIIMTQANNYQETISNKLKIISFHEYEKQVKKPIEEISLKFEKYYENIIRIVDILLGLVLIGYVILTYRIL